MPNAVSISEWPACVADRAIPGHWEGDLIEGSNTTCIATLVERHSRYLALIKLKNKRTDTVVEALIKQSKNIPTELYKSLTWDRGTEMKSHRRFTVATDIQYISVIHNVDGNAVLMKIPIAYCANIFQKELIYLFTHKRS